MKNKILLMFTMLVMVLSFGTSMEVEAKSVTVTVSKATEGTAKKLDKQLKKGKSFSVKVKGNKNKSKELLQKVNKKLQKVNKYSVKMNASYKKTKRGYSYYSVSADNAKLYKYTIDFLKDAYTKNDFYASWEEAVYVKADDYEETRSWVLDQVTHEEYYTYKQLWKKDFCNLSTLQQARVVTAQIGAYIPYGNSEDIQVNKKGYSEGQLMKRLATRKASGTCGDIALYQCLVFDQIGIKSYLCYSEKRNHGIVAFKVTNSAGKAGWLSSDSGHWGKGKLAGDWKLRYASKKVIKEVNTMTFSNEDIQEAFVKGYDDYVIHRDGYGK